ncbi:MAG: hypothetical protein RMK92_01260 [Armatimonadota bacterium]|nr:hypothetical protein [Armatimonadota bacterium]MDW8103615.1 hypothetical protein [Armatimonadota bacterium]
MAYPAQVIQITDIDVDSVEKDSSFATAYAFYLQLSEAPNEAWKLAFSEEWKAIIAARKLQLDVVGDRLRCIVSEGDDLRRVLQFAREFVERINERVPHYCAQLEERERREEAYRREVEERKEQIRARLRAIAQEMKTRQAA